MLPPPPPSFSSAPSLVSPTPSASLSQQIANFHSPTSISTGRRRGGGGKNNHEHWPVSIHLICTKSEKTLKYTGRHMDCLEAGVLCVYLLCSITRPFSSFVSLSSRLNQNVRRQQYECKRRTTAVKLPDLFLFFFNRVYFTSRVWGPRVRGRFYWCRYSPEVFTVLGSRFPHRRTHLTPKGGLSPG